MKSLIDYPVSFPYGATTDPYTAAHPHRGNDRACPLRTPIIVCGITIGFVGMTGLATGPHCHTHEWQGNKLNVRKPKNEFKPGTVTEVDMNGVTGDKSLGKFVTIQSEDGWNLSYCHMDSVNAKVGDIIKEKPVSYIEPGTVRSLSADFEVPLTEDQVQYYSKHPGGYTEIFQDFLKYNYDKRKQLEKVGEYQVVSETLYRKKV